MGREGQAELVRVYDVAIPDTDAGKSIFRQIAVEIGRACYQKAVFIAFGVQPEIIDLERGDL